MQQCNAGGQQTMVTTSFLPRITLQLAASQWTLQLSSIGRNKIQLLINNYFEIGFNVQMCRYVMDMFHESCNDVAC